MRTRFLSFTGFCNPHSPYAQASNEMHTLLQPESLILFLKPGDGFLVCSVAEGKIEQIRLLLLYDSSHVAIATSRDKSHAT